MMWSYQNGGISKYIRIAWIACAPSRTVSALEAPKQDPPSGSWRDKDRVLIWYSLQLMVAVVGFVECSLRSCSDLTRVVANSNRIWVDLLVIVPTTNSVIVAAFRQV
eukprot:9058189-Pyramimonas_sp.AAC.1